MVRTSETDAVCGQCWDRAIYAYGTGSLFLRRSRFYKNQLLALSFAGIAFPLLVGGVALAFGLKARSLPYILSIAAVVGVVQLLVSALSITYGWADRLAYASESAADNFALATKFRELGSLGPAPPENMDVRFVEVRAQDDARRLSDARQGVSEKELRYGHRAGLRQHRRACSGCGKIPDSMKASECDVCGRF
jgi:mobilome CxxCx(11)CxxC protein